MNYRVYLHSTPSPGMEYYDGYVDVVADDEEQAVDRAMDKLSRTSFPDRNRSCWRVDRVERIHSRGAYS